MDNSWVFDIQTSIYSRLKGYVESKLRATYPKINVTMDSHKLTKAEFPNVYIHFLAPIEDGRDLIGEDVNAVYLTAQVEVTVDESHEMMDAERVSRVVSACMKEMRFGATLPEFVNTDSEYRTVSRFARMIGQGDTLYDV